MKYLFFFTSFFLQISTGLPVLPLFLFWQTIMSSFIEIIFWSILTGVSFYLTLGSLLYGIGIAILISMLIVFIRTHLFVQLTPFGISLLLFLTLSIWYRFAFLIFWHYPLGIASMFFGYSLIFFIFYAIYSRKKTDIQRRLF